MLGMCLGMYRACSTWQYEVASHLVESAGRGKRSGFLDGPELTKFLLSRNATPEKRRTWGVLKTHERDAKLGNELRSERGLGIYAYRDLRDVAFSLIHKFGSSFDEIVEARGMLEQLIKNHSYWTSQPHTLVQRYEVIIDDPVYAVTEIATHLGISISRQEARTISAEYSFDSNRSRTEKLARKLRAGGVNLDDPRNVGLCDPQSLLHWNHLRQGEVGGWRDLITPTQRRKLGELCGLWLIEYGYELDLSWAFDSHVSGVTSISSSTDEFPVYNPSCVS